MKKNIKVIIQVLLFVFPWFLRRHLLNLIFKYNIHKSARIGFAIVMPDKLEMEVNAVIRNGTFINDINNCKLEKNSKIGRRDWITGTNTNNKTIFQYSPARKCEFILGVHAHITGQHFIDCTGGVYIGSYTTIAGIRTQILSHGVDIAANRQTAKPTIIGKYCFISTGCILLMGTKLPDKSVLGAGSVLTKSYEESFGLYAGVPARLIKTFNEKITLYFHRKDGHVI